MNKTLWAVLLKAAGPLAENRRLCRLRGDLNRNGVPRFCNTTSSLLAPLIPVCGLLYLAVASCGKDVHFIELRHAWTQKNDHRGAMVLLFQLVPKAGLEPARF